MFLRTNTHKHKEMFLEKRSTSERLEDVVQEVISKYGIRRSESSSAADYTSECEDTSEIGFFRIFYVC